MVAFDLKLLHFYKANNRTTLLQSQLLSHRGKVARVWKGI